MRLTLILPAIGLLALATAGCGNNMLSQPGGGPTPTSTAANPGAAQSTLNAGGQAGGPLVPGNFPPRAAQSGTTMPPMAAAPPPAAREFVVYFAFDKATLSPQAHSVIEQAAANAKQSPATHIAVTGHTDTVGTEQHNQGLSERRAAAVQQALVAQGVSADQISASGVGKSQPAVDTGPNVNEPRNRRVVITEGGPGA